MPEKIYTVTVSQINRYIKKMLDGATVLGDIWVKGEISNFKRHYSGHCYLTLKDEGGVLRAVMFRASAAHLPFEPENGMKVLARGRVSVYERDGAYQLYIEQMQPDGLGALHLAYEQLKARLGAEGLFDAAHKKPIPPFPRKIGVVTATTGAAIRDILNILSRRFPLAVVVIYPSLVQGADASANLVRAISYFNRRDDIDVLIVGRGGGSIEDLWAFNEEATARAIYSSHIPVISAVGHETDFTIADFVADLRAPTPSAAAELATPAASALHEQIGALYMRLCVAMKNELAARRAAVAHCRLVAPADRVRDLYLSIDDIMRHMERNLALILSRKRDALRAAVGRLDAMSPLAVLSRGYSIAKDEQGRVIGSVGQLPAGTAFSLVLSDGERDCRAL